ncbi:prespore-specific transcriptional regulator rsfA [Gracilibacillus halophilus YIM-C55.5]|uniref:Prespore-specific transcriptional regulator rsfA n=1 Tax=Gracilibacillus halophilus YIM-C55.5 TaxID=1308866 RepID=N4WVC8_9BACI|nr:RsfA family transcriptional regulator [Gracilibacillus halophilus]ENH98340.1 prespore-specific transcriptional regulator rsfA [Gracilibacillus halophilus YIM-C55.5]
MRGNRQDAWTKDEDILLAETVLRYIREGKTQLEAFKEVGDELSRTPAACGFRWNAALRKNYEDAIQMAKTNRKKEQTQWYVMETEHLEEFDNQEIIQLLQKLQSYYAQVDDQTQLEVLRTENRKLKQYMEQMDSYLSKIEVYIEQAKALQKK